MKKNIQAESFAGIIIWVFILSITLVWISNIVWYTHQTLSEYWIKQDIQTLERNTYKILQKLDTSSINVGEEFYIFRDTNNYNTQTGSSNANSAYINSLWEQVADIANYQWRVYSRVMTLNYRDTQDHGVYDYSSFTITHVLDR